MTTPYNPPDEFDEIDDEPEDMSQTGKSYQDMLQYLLSGESDDLSIGFNDNTLD